MFLFLFHNRYFPCTFLKEPRDPGQNLSRRDGPTSLGELWVEGAGTAECVCLSVETGDLGLSPGLATF